MALAIDASSPSLATTTASATLTTAAFTTPANVCLLAMVVRDTAPAGTNEGTVSGAGLTWSLAGRKGNAGTNITPGGTNENGVTELWVAYSVSALTSVTVTDTAASATAGHALQVMVITGAESTWGGAIAANGADNSTGTAVPATCNVTTTAAGSWVFSSSSDWNSAGAATVGSGQTLISSTHLLNGTVTDIYANIWRQTATTTSSGTVVTQNLTAPTNQMWNELAIEIRASTGAAAAPRRVPTNVTQARQRAAVR